MASAAVTYTFHAKDSDRPSAFAEVNENFDDLVDFLNDNCIQKDGSLSMSSQLILGTQATTDNHAASKVYTDFVIAVGGSQQPLTVGVTMLFEDKGALGWSGFLRCDGAEYVPSAYQTLYNLIGTTYGGNVFFFWVFSFKVPNLTSPQSGMAYYIKYS